MRISDWELLHEIKLLHTRPHGVVRVEDGVWVVHTSDRVVVKLDLDTGDEMDRIDVPESHPEPHGLTLFEDGLAYCDAVSGWIAKIDTKL